MLSAQRWPTPISEAELQARHRRTGVSRERRCRRVKNGALQYLCNTLVSYSAPRHRHVRLNVIWDWEPPAGAGDRHFAVYRGRTARVEVRQTKADGYRPELYCDPEPGADAPALLGAVSGG